MPIHVKVTYAVAIVILLAGVARLILGDQGGRFDETTLLYFFGAAAVFLLSRAKTFKFGDLELELEQLKNEVKEARIVANIAQDSVALERPTPSTTETAQGVQPEKQPGAVANDPWKGVFGGKSVDRRMGRQLTAEVLELPSLKGWYAVTLKVAGVPGAAPLGGEVRFFLHDTFPNNRPVVRVANGEARLHLKAWGAFTVGALTDDGTCELELDLEQLSSAPVEFRSR